MIAMSKRLDECDEFQRPVILYVEQCEQQFWGVQESLVNVGSLGMVKEYDEDIHRRKQFKSRFVYVRVGTLERKCRGD
jgi:hypothetical protein